jgi:hypothetical protein
MSPTKIFTSTQDYPEMKSIKEEIKEAHIIPTQKVNSRRGKA